MTAPAGGAAVGVAAALAAPAAAGGQAFPAGGQALPASAAASGSAGDPAASQAPSGPGSSSTSDGAAPADADAGFGATGSTDAAAVDPTTQTLGADGGEALKAVSRAGAGSSRARTREEAERRTIGEFVNGDKYVIQLDGERVPLRLLSASVCDEARHAFVAPDGWEAFRNRLNAQRIVILRGRPGRGRDTLATRLLLSRGIEEIYALDRQVDLGRLAERIAGSDIDATPTEPTGYLLSTPGKVDGLNRLGSALEHANAWIVLTVGDQTPLSDDEHQRYVDDIPETPGADKILASHLRFHFGDAGGPKVLDAADVKAFIEQALPQITSCEQTAALARILWQETRDGVTDIARVRERHRRRDTDRLGIWFAGLGDADTRSLAIALGVLDGLPIDDVLRAARGLRDRLATSGTIGLDADGTLRQNRPDPLRAGVSERLERLDAAPIAGYVVRPDGRVPTTRLSFRDEKWGSRIIERIWSDYQIQPILLEWLRWLMTDPVDEVRIQASTKVGRLAAQSFDLFDRSLFTPWATRGTAVQREAVAIALGFVVTYEPRVRPVVLSMINGWRGSEQPMLQAAAARAYGSSIGLSEPAAAFDALGRLATVDNIHVAIAIGDSLADMLTSEPSLASEIFRTLQTWTADRRRGPVGELCFLVIANGLTTVPDGDTAWPTEADMAQGGGPRATLLDYVHERPTLREPLFDLWVRVLNSASQHQLAANVFTQWAAQVENDDSLRTTFGRMARALAEQSARTRSTLRRLATDWVDEDNLQPLPHTAAMVRSVVGR